MQKLVPRYKNGGNAFSPQLGDPIAKYGNGDYLDFIRFKRTKDTNGNVAVGRTIAASPFIAGANLGIGVANLGIGTWNGAKWVGDKLTDEELWDGDGVKAVWDGTKFVGRGIGAGAKGVWTGTKWLGEKIGTGAAAVGKASIPHLPAIGNIVGNVIQAKYSLENLSKPVTTITPPKLVNQNVQAGINVDPTRTVFREAFHTGKVRSNYTGSDSQLDMLSKMAAAREAAKLNQNQAAIEGQNRIEQLANQTRQQNLSNEAAAATQRGALAALNENNKNAYLADRERAKAEQERQNNIAAVKGGLVKSVFDTLSTHIGNVQNTRMTMKYSDLAEAAAKRERDQGYYNYYKSKLLEKSTDGKLTKEQEDSLLPYQEASDKSEEDYNTKNKNFRERYFGGLGS
jgi:hypothetical protein